MQYSFPRWLVYQRQQRYTFFERGIHKRKVKFYDIHENLIIGQKMNGPICFIKSVHNIINISKSKIMKGILAQKEKIIFLRQLESQL